MKIRKPLIATILGLSLLSFGTGANAAEIDTSKDSTVIQSSKQLEPGTMSIMAKSKAPTNKSTTKVYNNLNGAYALAKSTSTTKEDYIYAKVRTYHRTGYLMDSKSVSAKKSSSVTAKAENTTTILWGNYAIGNHTYKLKGYKDVVHETKDKW
ncbi:XoxI protein [Niallia taxi]|uniref:XoxI protein n=1 Tax=Niallia taxi TaxID=2499688 RepID=UPI003981F1AC